MRGGILGQHQLLAVILARKIGGILFHRGKTPGESAVSQDKKANVSLLHVVQKNRIII